MALNNAWANSTFYSAMAGLSEAEFTAPRPGFFPSICKTMNHIYEVDLFYVDALVEGGLGRSVYDRDPVTEIGLLGELQADVDMRLAVFCSGLNEDDLSRRVLTERGHDPNVTEEIGALLLHLFQHQIHHRGQAHVQLQDAGVAPPQLDDFHLEDGRVPSAMAYFG
ncbi:DinB family protein [Pseudoruegeria sp. HB172150]|uniref:DinB family protein n=1 Tax=Pseudoruegeria sp. HB172150 TaxID=2721164 RepID=UPI0020A6ADE0|nr:DinB family protein [Pseudoruegeria sp. HB172150]